MTNVSAGLWLLLVLALSGCVEVIQNTLNIVKCGSVIRFTLPTCVHDLIKFSGAIFRTGHPVASLDRAHDLTITHAWSKIKALKVQIILKCK